MLPDDPFRIEVEAIGGDVLVILAPIGELDLATTGRLRDVLLEHEVVQPKRLVLDLRGLAFMDCCGLRVLLDAATRATEAHRRLQVASAGRQVKRLLSLSGADKRLDLISHPSEWHDGPGK